MLEELRAIDPEAAERIRAVLESRAAGSVICEK